MIPERVWAKEVPEIQDMAELLHEASRLGIPKNELLLLETLSMCTPVVRLALNLTRFLELTAQKEIKTVLEDGLTVEEKALLCALDSVGLPIPLREVAHGLLNVHARWKVLQTLKKPFGEARRNKSKRLGAILLEWDEKK